jgi:hypothetical protein
VGRGKRWVGVFYRDARSENEISVLAKFDRRAVASDHDGIRNLNNGIRRDGTPNDDFRTDLAPRNPLDKTHT